MAHGSEGELGPATRLLLTEKNALLPILRRTSESTFLRPTICTGWNVRDVLAHCSAALTRVANGDLHGFTPEDNEADVSERRTWALDEVISELEHGYAGAARAIAASGGTLDGVALGEWIHGGDVRDALGEPRAYASEGVEDALDLLAALSRRSRRNIPYAVVHLEERTIILGKEIPDRSAAELTTDTETLVRLCSGRQPRIERLTLRGASPIEFRLFG